MAVTKKSLISNSTSKKTTIAKSSPKTPASPITAAKLATAAKFAKRVPGMQPTLKVF